MQETVDRTCVLQVACGATSKVQLHVWPLRRAHTVIAPSLLDLVAMCTADPRATRLSGSGEEYSLFNSSSEQRLSCEADDP
jgi:hypothetical protein